MTVSLGSRRVQILSVLLHNTAAETDGDVTESMSIYFTVYVGNKELRPLVEALFHVYSRKGLLRVRWL